VPPITWSVVHPLWPEIALLATAIVVLVLDLLFLRQRPHERRVSATGGLSLLGIAIAIGLTLAQLGNPARAFGDMLVYTDLAVFVKLIVLLLAAATASVSFGHCVTRHVGEYFALVLVAAIGMLFLCMAEELVMVFVALELTSLSLYMLTAFDKALNRSAEGAVKYFVFGAVASAFLYFGMSYLYGLTGETRLAAVAEGLARASADSAFGSSLAVVALAFVLVGFGFKIAIVPFHLWAPDAYEGAPTPITAFLATGSKVASFVILIKFLIYGFPHMQGAAFISSSWRAGWAPLLALCAALSMILGNLVAIRQTNVKRLLAYSGIGHSGYILVGVLAANEMAWAAVVFYLLVYGLTNLGAFGAVAAVDRVTGGDDFEHFSGISRRAPVVALMMAVFVLSLAGIPPLSGFVGKFYLFAAAMARDDGGSRYGLSWLVALGIVMSAISLYYYLLILKQMYIIAPKSIARARVPRTMTAALVVLAVLVILLGVYPGPVIGWLQASTPQQGASAFASAVP